MDPYQLVMPAAVPAPAPQAAYAPVQPPAQALQAAQPVVAAPVAAPAPVAPPAQPVATYGVPQPAPLPQPVYYAPQPAPQPGPSVQLPSAQQQAAQQVAAQPPVAAPMAAPMAPSPVGTPEALAAAVQQHAFTSLTNQLMGQMASALPGMQQTAPAASYAPGAVPGHPAVPAPVVNDLSRVAGLGAPPPAPQAVVPGMPGSPVAVPQVGTQVGPALPPGLAAPAQPSLNPTDGQGRPIVQAAQPQQTAQQTVQDPIQQFAQHASDAEFTAGLGQVLGAIDQQLKMEGHLT